MILTAAGTNNTTGEAGLVSVAVSGATTTASSDVNALRLVAHAANALVRRASAVSLLTLTAGSNTFTTQYKTSNAGSVQTFSDRDIIVIPIF